MKLTRVIDNKVVDVTVPDKLPFYTVVEEGDVIATRVDLVSLDDSNWFNALQQWTLFQGYAPPSRPEGEAFWKNRKYK